MTKIMLVEDDNNLREIYGARLSAEGYEIVFAQDGEEALALAVKEKPELIVSDVMMPKISGFDMLDILRNAPETKNTKVIMMTALSQAEDQERAERLGADKYLVKSQVTLEDVVKTIKEVLGETTSETPETPASSQVADTNNQPATTNITPESTTQPTSEPNVTPQPGSQATVTQSTIEVSTPPSVVDSTPIAQPPASSAQSPVETTSQPGTSDPTTSPQPTPETSPAVATSPVQTTSDDNQATSDDASPQQDDNNATPSSPATPITVTLPDDPTQPESDSISQVTGNSYDASQSQDDSASPQTPQVTPEPEVQEPKIGPDLNEALHNAEDEIKKEINTMESPVTTASSAPAVANGGEVPQIVQPSEQPQPTPVQADVPSGTSPSSSPAPQTTPVQVQATPQAPESQPIDNTPPATTEQVSPESKENTGITEDQNGKKTINPINDLSSKPDLNELLAKEQASSGIENPPASSVITPGGEVSANTVASSQPETNTEPSTDSVQTKESPITPAPAPNIKDDIAL